MVIRFHHPFAVLSLLLVAAPSILASEGERAPRLVVLDVELTGDLGGPEASPAQQARLEMASTMLRDELERAGLYEVIDTAPAQALIDELRSRYRYLHNCNACDLEIGQQLSADEVLVAWVHRVSALILTLNYEIHDVSTGQIVVRKSFDFRGDNDAAWKHAIRYLVRDLKAVRHSRQAGWLGTESRLYDRTCARRI